MTGEMVSGPLVATDDEAGAEDITTGDCVVLSLGATHWNPAYAGIAEPANPATKAIVPQNPVIIFFDMSAALCLRKAHSDS